MIASILKQLRESKHLTQQDVAIGINVNSSTYKNYEYGRREPDLETVSKIADFYGITTDYLLGREPLPDPFADLNINREDEEELIETYLSFPPEVRACLMDAIIKLGEAAKGEREQQQLHNSIQQSTGRMMTEKIIAFGGDNEENEISEDELIERFRAIKEQKKRDREEKK